MKSLCLGLILSSCAFAAAEELGDIRIELMDGFASFTNRSHPDNRIGYRFHEHTPLSYGSVPAKNSDTKQPELTPAEERFKARPGTMAFHQRVTDAGWVPQDWTFYLAPVEDGIDLLWVVKAEAVGLPEFYGVQQCFRLTGCLAKSAWRQRYARTAAFSEYDLWQNAPPAAAQTSLTWVLRDGALQPLPAGKDTIGCRTRYGEALDIRRNGGRLDLLEPIGPYHARMLWTGDSGLILRTSADGKWSTGLYWERTTHLSDHHPADCLHAIVNLGGVAPNEQRSLRGKIYWLAGPGKTVVEHWHQDFPDAR